MDKEIRNLGPGATTRREGKKESEWTERIIICLNCGWHGEETPRCPRCGIPLTNYSVLAIPE